MVIKVREKAGRDFRIFVPTGFLLNRVTARLMPGALEKKGVAITGEQMTRLIRVLKACRKRNRGWKLMEIESSDGIYVEIFL